MGALDKQESTLVGLNFIVAWILLIPMAITGLLFSTLGLPVGVVAELVSHNVNSL